MIGYACFYRRGDAQRLVNPSEIVVHEVEGHGRFQVLHLFREGICRPGKGIASSFAYWWSDSLSILTIVHEMHTLPREIQLHSYLKSYNIIL